MKWIQSWIRSWPWRFRKWLQKICSRNFHVVIFNVLVQVRVRVRVYWILTYFLIILLFLSVKFEIRTQNRTEQNTKISNFTEQNRTRTLKKNFDRTQNRTELEKRYVLSSLVRRTLIGGRVKIHFKLESPWSNLFIYVYLLFFSRSKVDCAEFISIYIILFM